MISDAVKKRYDAFWHHDAVDRCCFFLSAGSGSMDLTEGRSGAEKWANIDTRLEETLHSIQNTKYYGDAFPTVFTNFGPGCLSSMIGGSHKWREDTVWFENEQVITDWENLPDISIRKDSEMYRLVDAFTERFIEAGKGKFMTSITDIGGTFDIIAALRGTQDFLMDLYIYPEEVKAFVKKLQPVWRAYYEQYANRLMKEFGAMTSWMPIYSDKIYYPLQCDFSAMISPDMFEEFVLPDLKYQISYMDRSVYHWDGPGEIPHLDHLLSIDKLSAIQWVPGAGQPDVYDPCWYENYERIQRAGKSLVLFEYHADGLERLLKNVSTKGLFLFLTLDDDSYAEDLVRMVDSYGVK